MKPTKLKLKRKLLVTKDWYGGTRGRLLLAEKGTILEIFSVVAPNELNPEGRVDLLILWVPGHQRLKYKVGDILHLTMKSTTIWPAMRAIDELSE